MRNLSALVCGSLFGAGLVISGCTDTETIHAWLDVFGRWEPTLGFFFVASCGVMALAWRLSRHLNRSLLGGPFPGMNRSRPSYRMIIGSVMFGVGWGMSGICPGPSMAGLTFSGPGGMLFFSAMVVGMYAVAKIRLHAGNEVCSARTLEI